ncbi:MAG: GNAT family N-acetyltransferase [Campylobacterales bacterium]|nr:GNAT family N-acetyltransferase [Campylobacterales bacterium]
MVYTTSLIHNWQNLLSKLYGYKSSDGFTIIPSLTGEKTLVYTPLLNYTDLTQVESVPTENYIIKLLNFDYHDFQENDPVTMRLDLTSDVFDTTITSKCRNQIRKAEKSELDLKIGSLDLLDDFYQIFRDTMNRYGTPVFDKKLFRLILENSDSKIIINYKDGEIASGLILIFDEEIAFVPWAGSNPVFSKVCSNHMIYWEAIKLSKKKEKKIFDFGRSPYGGATYSFKKQWGAKPVKIDIIRNKEEDIYSKYSFASKIYKMTPNFITDFIGPKLCKYLADL